MTEPATVVMGLKCVRCRRKIGAMLSDCNPRPILEAIDANILCENCLRGFLLDITKRGVRAVNLRTDGRDPLADVAN